MEAITTALVLPTTLCAAAAAAIINICLSLRIGKVRMGTKIFHGDGGNEALMRRMRAQANFIENTPLVLVLIAAVELAGRGGIWLAIAAAVFVLGRLSHPLGMDNPKPNLARGLGAGLTMLVQLVLAAVAVLIALRVV